MHQLFVVYNIFLIYEPCIVVLEIGTSVSARVLFVHQLHILERH